MPSTNTQLRGKGCRTQSYGGQATRSLRKQGMERNGKGEWVSRAKTKKMACSWMKEFSRKLEGSIEPWIQMCMD